MESPNRLDAPARAARVRELGFVDMPRTAIFGRLARLARSALRADGAMITVADETQQCFVATDGLPEPWQALRTTPLDHTLCHHVVRERTAFVVEDARAHPAVRDDPALRDPGIVAWLGVPLREDDLVLGCFAVFTREPRAWSDADREHLEELAALTVAEAEERWKVRHLVDSARRFQLVARATHDVIWDLDLATGALTWTDALLTTFGYPVGPEVSQSGWWQDHIHPDDRARILESYASAVASGPDMWSGEYRFLRADGTYARVIDRCYIDRAADGRATRIVGTIADLSARAALDDQLHEAHRLEAIGRLAGGVAHDFNNLLTAILASAELALDGLQPDGDPALVVDDLQEIRAAATRAAALTRQLLAFARRQTLQLEALDLNEVLLNMERLLRLLVGAVAGLRIVPADEPAPIRADRTQLEQVITNLAVNARDAMRNGGELSLAVEVEPGASDGEPAQVRLVVTDTGEGIPPETLGRVFEPFFTTKELGKGTGLGLATVHGIVQQLRGTVTAASTPGVGTTFTVRLPRA